MSSNNKIGAKCLTNLHLKLSDKWILEAASTSDKEEEGTVGGDQEKEEGKEKEKEDQKEDKENQETVPTIVHKEAEGGSLGAQEEVQEQRQQEEALSEGEASQEEEGEELNDDDDTSSDKELRMPMKKKLVVTPRKSSRLASKGKRLVVGLDDDFSSHTALKPQTNVPPSLKPATPPTHHIPSPPPSPIPSTPPPTTATPASPHPYTSPVFGFVVFSNPSSVPTATLDLVLKNSRFFSPIFSPSKMKFMPLLPLLLISSLKWKHV